MTGADWVTTVVAVVALCLSLFNTVFNIYGYWRARRPRVIMHTYWVHPPEAPMALRGTGDPDFAPSGKAIYKCEIVNKSATGVKIRRVNIWPQAPPGRPLPMSLAEEEEPKTIANGDSQTWRILDHAVDEQNHKVDPTVRGHVKAWDTSGNIYDAKDPETYPYPYGPYG